MATTASFMLPTTATKRPASAMDECYGGAAKKRRVGARRGKHCWTAEEHARLAELIARHGKRWSVVAEQLPGRDGKQCRERWHNHLNPERRKGQPWTEEEDAQLEELRLKMGNCWAALARHFPGRTDNDLKNRHYSRLRRAKRAARAKSVRADSDIVAAAAARDAARDGRQQQQPSPAVAAAAAAASAIAALPPVPPPPQAVAPADSCMPRLGVCLPPLQLLLPTLPAPGAPAPPVAPTTPVHVVSDDALDLASLLDEPLKAAAPSLKKAGAAGAPSAMPSLADMLADLGDEFSDDISGMRVLSMAS